MKRSRWLLPRWLLPMCLAATLHAAPPATTFGWTAPHFLWPDEAVRPPQTPPVEPPGPLIVIDAGHGGPDEGAIARNGLREKDVTLDVALRLASLLRRGLRARVELTRAYDTYVPLRPRIRMANAAAADLFVSIHANSAPTLHSAGVETYFPEGQSPPSRASRTLAHSVQVSLATIAHPAQNRGVKRADFAVLDGAAVPAILAEIGFLSNATEARALGTPAYRETIAEGLYDGLAVYLIAR